MELLCASFNVLADAWLGYGKYTHVDPELLKPRVRIPRLVQFISNLQADVVGLQEVEPPLIEALAETGEWKWFWSPNEGGEPDGCLTLVRQDKDITVEKDSFKTYAYSDGSNHIVQSVIIGRVAFANTHIQYHNPADNRPHVGAAQTKELLAWLGKGPAVIFADCNDRHPDGPVRELVKESGFTDISGNVPTAHVGEERAALDIIAVREVRAEPIMMVLPLERIPNVYYPSDHIPIMARIETG